MPRQVQTINLGNPSSTSERTISFSWNWPAGPLINAGLRDNPNAALRLDTIVVSRLGSIGILTINLVRGFFVGGDLSRTMERQGSVTISNPTAGTLKYTSTGGSAFDNEPYSYSGGTQLATWITDLHGASDKRVTITFDDNDFKTDIQAITFEHSLSQPNGQRLAYAEPYPASTTLAFNARDRTRSSGTLWEWNTNIPQLSPPFVDADATLIRRLRLGSDRIFLRDPDNSNPGISSTFEDRGTLTIYSPTRPDLGEVAFVNPEFSGIGRYNPAADSGWSEFWAGFETDTANTVSLRFDIPGPSVLYDLGRPEAIVDITKYGEPQPITFQTRPGTPNVYAHTAPIAFNAAVGRPYGYRPTVGARAATAAFITGRPHGFAHAEFIQFNLSASNPIAQVKRSVNAIAMEPSAGRPAATIFGVPGSTGEGDPVSESHAFGTRTLVRTDANSTWQWNTNLTLPEPIMAATSSPIIQVHVRANQVRFITTGGSNPGFSDAFNSTGRLTLTRVGGSSFTITGPGFDHLGRTDPSGLDGYATWWNEFSVIGGSASQLTITWEIDGAAFQPYLAHELAVGKPESRTKIEGVPDPIVAALSTGMPDGQKRRVATIQGITFAFSVGRPRGYSESVGAESIALEYDSLDAVALVRRAARPITGELTAGRPYPFARGAELTLNMRTGMPRGYSESVGAAPITFEFRTGRPHGFAHAEFITFDLGVGRPIARVKRAARPITAEQALGRPQSTLLADGTAIRFELSAGRPRAESTKAARPITAGLSVGQPISFIRRFGRPRRLRIRPRVGLPAAIVFGASNPIRFDLSVTNPTARTKVTGVPLAITNHISTDRPTAIRYSVPRAITMEAQAGRPRGAIPSVAALGIDLDHITGMPLGERRRVARGVAIAQDLQLSLPVGLVLAVGTESIVEHILSMPQSYFARRNPVRQEDADAVAGGVITDVRAGAILSSAAANSVKHQTVIR